MARGLAAGREGGCAGGFEALTAIKKNRKKGAQAVGLTHNSRRAAREQPGVDQGRDCGLLLLVGDLLPADAPEG